MRYMCVRFAFLSLLVCIPVLAQTQPSKPAPVAADSCETDPGFHKLDFWLGNWDVFVKDQKVGTNQIEKILSGCAVTEYWADADGSQGKSLFYYLPATKRWRQVWVTEQANRTGGVKEKELIEELKDGGLRFQGEIMLPTGKTYLDRTTLTPLSKDKVRQVIEFSMDGGKSWKPAFDAIYLRKD
ncbi:MAG TPA: hypothetical protein PLL06_15790 [Acidobacteriota bacterium]|nr:hypothetical protein [Acidobacteriota bacterium]HMZ81164.1 hypothetical protein [Acidobacteriota bacterium]HNB72246.1 hypothetical protein [Acidobacteriota bacterium]HND19783.1 hypothetical protein [Acidobacteriota bacterium]HNH81505.1 hypothetical protein [Acidobacteriota bacterium]